MFVDCLKAFVVGGAICAVGQILIDRTKLTPARILVIFLVAGIIMGAFGIYEPIIEFAGAGAMVPLTGFGYSLAAGVQEAIATYGLIGAFTGGLTATAGGIAATILFAFLVALVAKPGEKS